MKSGRLSLLFLLLLPPLLATAAVSLAVPPQVPAFAEGFSVTTGKAVYAYGDYLSFTVQVPEVKGSMATFRIIDEFGVGGSPVQMAITGKTSELAAPNPFESYIFREGTYTLQVDYEGNAASAEFVLVDSGITVIPFWIKDVAGLWSEGVIDDGAFLKNLADHEVITLEASDDEFAKASIPQWYKTNTAWWKNGMISDGEFAKGLQYIIAINAVTFEDGYE